MNINKSWANKKPLKTKNTWNNPMPLDRVFSSAARLVRLQDEAKAYAENTLEEMKKHIDKFAYSYHKAADNSKHVFFLPAGIKVYINTNHVNITDIPSLYFLGMTKGRSAIKSPCMTKAGHVFNLSNKNYRFTLEDYQEGLDLFLSHYIADHYPKAVAHIRKGQNLKNAR